MTDDVQISVGLDTKKVKSGRNETVKSLDDIRQESEKLDRSTGRLNKSIKGTGETARAATAFMKGFVGAFSVKAVLQVADAYTVLQTRIKTATASTGDYLQVSNEIFNIAQKTGTALNANVEVFQRMALGAKDLGKSNTEVLRLVESVQKLGVIGGSSSESLKAGLLQFGQAMSAGVVRAEEFNSIVENIPEVANKIAEGLGVSTGQLRQMVLQGKVLSSDVFEALEKQTASIDETFERIPLSLDRALVKAQNATAKFFGDMEQKLGIVSGLANLIDKLSSSTAVFEGVVLALGTAIAVTMPKLTMFSLAAWGIYEAGKGLINLFPDLGKSVRDIESPFKALQATFIFVKGEFLKFVNDFLFSVSDWKRNIDASLLFIVAEYEKFSKNIGNLGVAVYEAFAAPFRKVGTLFTALKTDLTEFITNPFAANAGFDNLQNSYGTGFLDDITKSYNNARKESELFSKQIDEKLNKSLSNLASQSEKARNELNETKGEIDKISEISMNQLISKADAAGAALGGSGAGVTSLSSGNISVAEGAEKAKESIEKLPKAIKEVSGPLDEIFKNTFNGIKDGFDNVFKNLFSKGKLDVRGFFDDIKNAFATTLSEMGSLAIAKPVIIPLVQGVGSALGLPQSGINKLAGQFGIPGGGTSSFGQGFGSSINQWGASNLGTFSPVPAAGAGYGPVAPASMGGSTGSIGSASLTSYAGGALSGGFMGYNIGSANVFGGTETGSKVGGTIGGAAGGVIGTAFGPAGTMVGSAIGSFLGSAIGGFFGGEATEASEFAGRFGEFGTISSTFGSKNADPKIAKGISAQVGTLGEFLYGIGADISETSLRGGYNTKQRGGGFFDINGETIRFDKDNADSINEALVKLTSSMLETANVTDQNLATAIENVQTEGRDLSEVLSDLEFAANFKNLSFTTKGLTDFEQQIETLKNQFVEAAKTAERLGLSVDKVREAEERQLENISKDFNQGILDQQLGILNPSGLSLKQLADTQAIRRRNAIASGGDIVEVEKLFALERQQLLEQALNQQNNTISTGLERQQQEISNAYSASLETISGIRNGLTFGSLGGTNALTRSNAADQQLEQLLQRVRSGDETVFDDLDGTINQSLDASLAYYGSTEEYLKRLSIVDTILNESKDLANSTLSTEQGILNGQIRNNELTLELLNNSVEQTRLLDESLQKTSNDVLKVLGVNRSNLLVPGESLNILDQINAKNDLSAYLVRASKLVASEGAFTFGSGISFDQFVSQSSNGESIGKRFNSLVEGFGGQSQTFNTNSKIINTSDNDDLKEVFVKQSVQSSKETTYLGELMKELITEVQDLNSNVSLGSSKNG